MHDCTFGMCSTCIHICSLCTSVATLLPSITRLQLASKFPTSSIMDQGMFWLLVLEHLSKQASNRLACPGACPSTRNGDDIDGVLKQCRAAQILISGAVFELVSLSQPVTLGNWWWVEKAAQQREKELAGLSTFCWQMPLLISQQRARVKEEEEGEHHLCIDILFSSAR